MEHLVDGQSSVRALAIVVACTFALLEVSEGMQVMCHHVCTMCWQININEAARQRMGGFELKIQV